MSGLRMIKKDSYLVWYFVNEKRYIAAFTHDHVSFSGQGTRAKLALENLKQITKHVKGEDVEFEDGEYPTTPWKVLFEYEDADSPNRPQITVWHKDHRDKKFKSSYLLELSVDEMILKLRDSLVAQGINVE